METCLVKVSGIGLCSALGGYKDACAAFRAGLNRYSKYNDIASGSEGDEEPEGLTVASVPGYMEGYQGKGRIIKMLRQAYRDLAENLPNPLPTNDLAIFMALPDPLEREDTSQDGELVRDERLQQYTRDITDAFFAEVNPALMDHNVPSIFGERQAFARAFEKAVAAIQAGECVHSLILVADSLLNYHCLENLLLQGRLKSGDNPVGFIPGEGAALILLSAPSQTAFDKTGAPAIRCRTAVALDRQDLDISEAKIWRETWLGNKLIRVIAECIESVGDRSGLPTVVSDFNGEEHRAFELAQVEVKLRQRYAGVRYPDPIIPALSFGDTGVMAGALALASVIASLQRKYASNRQFCIALSDDSGKRSAIYLRFE